jgi:hypothetical protein
MVSRQPGTPSAPSAKASSGETTHATVFAERL